MYYKKDKPQKTKSRRKHYRDFTPLKKTVVASLLASLINAVLTVTVFLVIISSQLIYSNIIKPIALLAVIAIIPGIYSGILYIKKYFPSLIVQCAGELIGTVLFAYMLYAENPQTSAAYLFFCICAYMILAGIVNLVHYLIRRHKRNLIKQNTYNR